MPGDPDRSMIIHRMSTRDRGRMPPLASSVVHEEGLHLLQLDPWASSQKTAAPKR